MEISDLRYILVVYLSVCWYNSPCSLILFVCVVTPFLIGRASHDKELLSRCISYTIHRKRFLFYTWTLTSWL